MADHVYKSDRHLDDRSEVGLEVISDLGVLSRLVGAMVVLLGCDLVDLLASDVPIQNVA